MLLRWIMAVLIALALPATIAMPACAAESAPTEGAPTEGAAAPEHSQHTQQRRPVEKAKPGMGSCIGCVAPSTARPPLLEAPNRALMMIPAGWAPDTLVGRPLRPATPPPRVHAFYR